MTFPIVYSNGIPNFAFNGATVVIAPQVDGYGVLELEAPPNRNLYVDAFSIMHGPDCQIGRLFSAQPTIIDNNRVEFPSGGAESFEGVLLTTGNLRYGTTTVAPTSQDQAYIAPSRQMKPPVADITIREFHIEHFRIPLFLASGTVAIIRSIGINEEVRLGIRWFEQAKTIDPPT